MKKKIILAAAAVIVVAAVVVLIIVLGSGSAGTSAPAKSSDAADAPESSASPEKTVLKPPVVSAEPVEPLVIEQTKDSDGRDVRIVSVPNAEGGKTEIKIYNDETGEQQAEPQENAQPAEVDPATVQAAAEYEWFMALSPSDQAAYSQSFEPYEAFFDWFNAAREAYNVLHQGIPIGPGDYIEVG